MKKLALLLCFAAVGFAPQACAQAGLAKTALRPITHQDVWTMKRLSDPVPSPDGRSIVFLLTEPDYDPAKQAADLWIVPTDGSAAPRRITSTRAPENGAVWSPDGTRLAFVTRREGDEAPQVYVMPMAGGEAVRVTSVPGGVSNPQWRPDGKAILFESDFDPVAAERKQRKSTARVFDAMPVRHWNVWMDERRPHVFVQELAEGAKPVDLLKGTKLAESSGFAGLFNGAGGQELQAVWAPDGQSVVFAACVNRDEMMSEETDAVLFSVPASGGEPRALTEQGQSFSHPKFSPRGDALFALHERRANPKGRLYSLTRLARFAWPGPGKPSLISEGWDRSVSSYSVARDGRTLYIAAEDDGFDQLFQMPAQGGTVERLFKVERGGYANIQPAGDALVATYQTAAEPAGLVRLNSNGSGSPHTRLTDFNAQTVAQLDVPPPVTFWFTAKDGRRIHNILFLPPKFDAAKKYPVVTAPHGGPNSMSTDAYSTRWNTYLLASPGYVILETDYMGSTGFGEKFADDIEKDVLRGPAQEILEAIEEAGHRYSYIDLTRQAALGASYGGYLMNWLNGHTNQFKCIVAHAGAINNESQYGVNDGGIDRELRMGVPIWEHGGQWNDQSPLRYSGNFKTPTLLTQGEQDFRVPLNESMTTFKILQRRKIPSRLIIFPDEGHWVQKGENSKLHMQEVLNWLAKYLPV